MSVGSAVYGVSEILVDGCPACVEYVPYGMDEEILLQSRVNEFLAGWCEASEPLEGVFQMGGYLLRSLEGFPPNFFQKYQFGLVFRQTEYHLGIRI